MPTSARLASSATGFLGVSLRKTWIRRIDCSSRSERVASAAAICRRSAGSVVAEPARLARTCDRAKKSLWIEAVLGYSRHSPSRKAIPSSVWPR